VTPYTAPLASPASIDDDAGLEASHAAVLADPSLPNAADGRDGLLVACYSEHSLVGDLAARHPAVAVAGILEASVLAALGLGGRWGVVTTGRFWEKHLEDGVARYLGTTPAGAGVGGGEVRRKGHGKFVGVFSTGLNAGDFHSPEVTEEVVRQRLREATRKLLQAPPDGPDTRVSTVVLGCAGMAGLGEIVREEAREVYGEEEGGRVNVVDPVRAGVVVLEGIIRNRRMFRERV
jgi:Asp/Glu/hydantoin racemase